MTRNSRSKRAGFTMIEVLIASVVLGVIAVSVSKMFSTSFKNALRIEQRGDLEGVKQNFLDALDCSSTFSAAGIDPTSPGASCGSTSGPSGQVGPFTRPKGYSATGGIFDLPGTWDNSDKTLTVGKWTLKTSCSASEHSLVIRAARPQGTGFFTDPLTNQVLDYYNHSRALVFGATTTPICTTSFTGGGTVTCPGGQYMTGYNPVTHAASCATLPPYPTHPAGACGAGTAMSSYNPNSGATTCAAVGTSAVVCGAGQFPIGNACKNVVGNNPGDLTQLLSGRFHLNCHIIQNLSPTNGSIALACPAGEFVAGGGGNCVDASGNISFAGGNHPGYVHQSWPVSSFNDFSVDCFHTGGGTNQGHATARIICCSLASSYP